jgi:uncharacterized protein YqeY
MTTKEQINADIKAAMKEGNSEKLTVLRGLIACLNNKAIEKRAKTGKEETLTEDEMMSALMTEAKKRKDAIALYQQGGREDLAAGEKNELAIISAYLPQQMSAQETEQAVDKILASLSVKEFGPAMKEVMKELKGKADAAVVTDLVKKKLG